MSEDRAIYRLELAVPDLGRPPETSPLLRCVQCHKPLAAISGDRVLIRIKGREYLVARPVRITCECGKVARLA